MPKEVRKLLLDTFRDGYQKAASRRQKTKLIDDFCFATKYSRKHAIRILNGKVNPVEKGRPGPPRKYDADLCWPLFSLWNDMNRICSKRMVAAIPLWLPYQNEISSSDKKMLISMSASTIDRMLKPFRKQKGVSTTRASMIKRSIPIKLLDGEVTEPGHLESDTVSHCGSALGGSFASSLTVTDLCTGWTENRATESKEGEKIAEATRSVLRSLPFKTKTWSSDNGSEFINRPVVKVLRKKGIEVQRRRPYKKNDAAHVEQKNWTHVRQLFGYERIEDKELVQMMNEIYQVYWSPLQNFFMPMMKLTEKTRVGGRIVKKYDLPKTPYQRVLDSGKLDLQERAHLKQRMDGKNPFYLKQELENKLKIFFRMIERKKIKLLENAA